METIREVIGNHCFSTSNTLPNIEIEPSHEALPYRELSIHKHLTRIDIKWMNAQSSSFNVRLCFSRYIDSDPDEISDSLYIDYFKLSEYHNFSIYEAVIEIDYFRLAQFVTYYFQYLGFSSLADATIEKYYSFTHGDISLTKLNENLSIPPTLQRAIEKLKEMSPLPPFLSTEICIQNESSDDSDCIMGYIKYRDDGLVYISSDIIVDDDQIDKRREYKNFDCIKYQWVGDCIAEEYEMCDNADRVMSFLTDYFLFLNPGIGHESISVTLYFSPEWARGHIEESDVLYYDFNPDGTESNPEQLNQFLDRISKKGSAYLANNFLSSHGFN
ncbi:MAG: hypothetical protein K2K86_04470 [Muribaculaceae bacterium]|nr:hypothetical protein [Muribaculaceae bacterium]